MLFFLYIKKIKNYRKTKMIIKRLDFLANKILEIVFNESVSFNKSTMNIKII